MRESGDDYLEKRARTAKNIENSIAELEHKMKEKKTSEGGKKKRKTKRKSKKASKKTRSRR